MSRHIAATPFASTPFLPSKKTVFLELHSSRAQPLSKQANARR
ncbi:hypothetical protein AD16_3504 [Escherichia coli 3-267-03_S4_C2]|nr:hypothetical protein AD16_3504 [Escherichia coli 3-267-03_S4_C2]KEL84798.1 hypothetical protein AC22_2490 [Escherichia coli 5-366-08_S3_C2]